MTTIYTDQIDQLRKKHQDEVQKVKTIYDQRIRDQQANHEKKLQQFESIIQKAVNEEEARIKNSLTWKIGRIPVAGFLLTRNLAFNPVRFFIDPQHRLKDILYFPEKNEKASSSESSPDIPELSEMIDNKPVLACVFDTFTYSCFKDEFNILKPTTENWESILGSDLVKGFFIESAWFGNDKTWTNRIGKFNNQSGILLAKIIEYCKSKGIPTIFWNKEDPVHFKYFLDDAAKFEYIFTTDSDMIPGYQEKNQHASVNALPFAAQPTIHNPVREEPRENRTCFAGTYYNYRYPERKVEMEFLLKPALDFGLDIYDRNFGATGEKTDHYRFPDIFQPVIKGRLEYTDMVRAYKRYKVFLNVNSVKYSPTMFARRVFELLACGTPVISTYSKGIINVLGEDTVLLTESEQDTRRHLETLFGDELYWWRKSLHGMRKVLQEHTYQQRTKMIFNAADIDFREPDPVSMVVVTEVASFEDAEYLQHILKNQSYQEFEVWLMPSWNDTFTHHMAETLENLFGFTKVTLIPGTWKAMKKRITLSDKVQYFAFMDLSHYYGSNYLLDNALAINYSGCGIIGKKAYHAVSGDSDNVTLQNSGMDYQYSSAILIDAMVIQDSVLKSSKVMILPGQDSFSGTEFSGLSIDPFNFLSNGRRLFSHAPEKVVNLIDL